MGCMYVFYLLWIGQKQFTKKTVYDAHFTGKKHRKNAEKLKNEQSTANGDSENNNDSNNTVKQDRRKELAWKELLITKYAEGLSDIREETKANVERKQALTDKERTVSIPRKKRHGASTLGLGGQHIML